MPKKSRKNVGLIGLGIIGSRVANALRQGGFHVYVWNRTPQAAPNFLASPRQVAELCDIIQIFVADAQALFEVLESMGDALTPSHIILCNATVGPEATLDAARMVQERGAQFLDAPFTGSKAAAQNRELIYYIGGDDKTLAAVEPVLKTSSKAIIKIGKIGDAAVIKVATNMISAVTVQTLAEAYAIVKESGIDPQVLGEALKHHAVRSGITDAKLPKILAGDYDAHFSLKHMFKDVQLGIHIANSLDIDLPATTSTAGVMYGGLTRGWADEDFSVLARNYQKTAAPAPLEAPKAVEPAKALDVPKPVEANKTPEGVKPVEAVKTVEPVKLVEAPKDVEIPQIVEKPVVIDTPPASSAEKKVPLREPSAAELRDVGIKVPEAPGKPEPVVAANGPSTGDKGVTEVKAGGDANGAPADGGSKDSHPPFVRIRRWFGTGASN